MNLKKLVEIADEYENPKTCIFNTLAGMFLLYQHLTMAQERTSSWLTTLVLVLILLNLPYTLIYIRYIYKKLCKK